MSNLRNDTGTKFRKYAIHEMDQAYLVMDSWNSSYEMYQSWIVGFRKCPIYEMAKSQAWISELTKLDIISSNHSGAIKLEI